MRCMETAKLDATIRLRRPQRGRQVAAKQRGIGYGG